MASITSNVRRHSSRTALLVATLAGWLSVDRRAEAQQAACDDAHTLDERTFVSTIAAGRRFIDEEDIGGYQLSSRAILDSIPCLAFVPRPEDWARYLIGASAVAYFRGEDWQSPLATALSIAPGIERGVSAEHEISSFIVADPPADLGASPPEIELFVDGSRAFRIPAPQGLHLVQVRREGVLRSALLLDAPIPPEWLAPSRARPPREGAQIGGHVAIGGGLRQLTQVVGVPGDFLPNSASWGPLGAGSAEIWAGRPVGLTLQLLATVEPRIESALLVSARSAHAAAGLGAAILPITHVEVDDTVRSWHPAPAGFVSAYTDALDGRLSVAAGPARYGWFCFDLGASAGNGDLRFRTGLVGRLTTARLAQRGSERTLAINDWAALLGFGIRWRAS